MPDYHLTILGSASGLPETGRSHAALAVHDERTIFLLDAGEGVCSALLRSRLDPLKVKIIFITHTHPDHCAGLFMLLQYLHMKMHRGEIQIYLPGGAIPAFQDFMNQVYLVNGHINPTYQLLPLEAEHELDDEWCLKTYPTHHLQRWQELKLPGLSTEAFAFRLHSARRSLFYSGDIASFDDISEVIQPEDLLIIEGAHIIEVEHVLNWALEAGMKRVVITHILPGSAWVQGDLVEQARKQGVEILLAREGMNLVI
jgi:ribonuclease BN (tRNA processing enzyme)